MSLRFSLKDIAFWPRSLRIATIVLVFVLIFVMGFYLLLQHRLSKMHSDSLLQTELKQKIAESYQQLKNIEIYQQENDKLTAVMNTSYLRFVSLNNAPSLINVVLQKVTESGLEMHSFTRSPVISKNFYSKEPMQLSLEGSYYQFAQLCNALVSLKTIVRITNFTMAIDPAKKDPDRLSIVLTVDLYYLNPLGAE